MKVSPLLRLVGSEIILTIVMFFLAMWSVEFFSIGMRFNGLGGVGRGGAVSKIENRFPNRFIDPESFAERHLEYDWTELENRWLEAEMKARLGTAFTAWVLLSAGLFLKFRKDRGASTT